MQFIFNGKKDFVHYIKIKRLSKSTLDYITIYHSEEFEIQDLLKSSNKIDIVINKSNYLNIIFTKCIIIKESKTQTKVEGFICEENGYVYNQDVIDVLYHWRNGRTVNWRSKTESFKSAYIKACSLVNYQHFKFINFDNNILDGKKVNSENDLYIMLGELFYGNGGCFGAGLDGLYDYLIDVNKNKFLDRITISIINKENLILKLGEPYYLAFINILKQKNVIVTD